MVNSNEVAKFLRRIKKALKKINVSIDACGKSSEGKAKYLLTSPNGESAFWSVSNTPRDRNGPKAAAKELRNTLASIGVEDTATISWNYVEMSSALYESIWDVLSEYEGAN
jgi:hypothetical protein